MKVQLIHLDGPFKGEIQDFFEPVIALGRHPDCQLVFPKECTAISRKHGEIKREGNRFKYIDHSANGTLINGKPQKEVFLKDGDVLIIGGEGGPKVSFISSKLAPGEELTTPESSPEPGREPEPKAPQPAAKPAGQPAPKKSRQQPSPSAAPSFLKPAPSPEPPPPQQPVQPPSAPPEKETIPVAAKNLTIQYGATLTSFKQLPITIGSSTDCDCTLQHPALLEQHAQIFFKDNQYRVKDLTGRGLVSVNQQPVQSEAPLQPDASLALSPTGPTFQFLGDGRLAEIETTPKQATPSGQQNRKKTASDNKRKKGKKGWLWF